MNEASERRLIGIGSPLTTFLKSDINQQEKAVKLKRDLVGLAALATAAIAAAPATATLPTPSMAAATSQAQPYLFHAGASDVFEITSSMILLNKSSNQQVQAYASMLIDHHIHHSPLRRKPGSPVSKALIMHLRHQLSPVLHRVPHILTPHNARLRTMLPLSLYQELVIGNV